MVIATEDPELPTACSGFGPSGDGGSSWWLPRLLGMRRAQELLIEGRVLRADEAEDGDW